MAASITTRLGDIEEQIDTAASQLESDSGASPALIAVFEELHRKTREARDTLNGADEDKIREYVAEVESGSASSIADARHEEEK